MTASEAPANSTNFWMTTSRSLTIELIETRFFLLGLFERDEKIMCFAKLTRISFLNEAAFNKIAF